MTLSNYIKICDVIVLLMSPLVEIVIHDIESDSIVYINGSFSKRKIGDRSLLDKGDLNNLEQIIYQKINFDGRLLKSVSVVLVEKWLLCINCDISVFTKMQQLSEVILCSHVEVGPKALFKNDWQEKLNVSVHAYLQNHNLSFNNICLTEKKALVKHLCDLGAFNEKNAADYVAKILNLSRSTVFKYLKELRRE